MRSPKRNRYAVIGMSCRFPGAANSPEAFWRLLENGTDAISEVPPDRWNIDQLFNSDPAAAGKMNSRWGGFIDQIDQFDPNFFGISPREASQMDPQQRLTLEVAWEAVEDAGLTKTDLAGKSDGRICWRSQPQLRLSFTAVCGSGYDRHLYGHGYCPQRDRRKTGLPFGPAGSNDHRGYGLFLLTCCRSPCMSKSAHWRKQAGDRRRCEPDPLA